MKIHPSVRLMSALITLIALNACGPVMRSVTDYDPPTTDAGVQCVSRANESLGQCKSDNAMAYQFCSDKASNEADQTYIAARDVYTEQLEIYIVANEYYERSYEKFEQQQHLIISKGELDYIRCSKDVNMTEISQHPNCHAFLDDAKHEADHLRKPRAPSKPYAPNKNRIFNHLVEKCQDTARNCELTFDQSFRFCGGTITTRQVCISNCD